MNFIDLIAKCKIYRHFTNRVYIWIMKDRRSKLAFGAHALAAWGFAQFFEGLTA